MKTNRSIAFPNQFVVKIALAALLSLIPASAAEAPFDAGTKLYSEGKFAQALKCFEDAEKQGRKDPGVYYYQALCYHQLKNYQRAQTLYAFIAQRFPGSSAAKLADSALKRSQPQTAMAGSAQQAEEMFEEGPEEAEIPFRRRGRGGHMYVNARINGHPVDMIFDTGAEYCLARKDLLEKMGVDMRAARKGARLRGVGGEMQSYVMPVELQAGTLKRIVLMTIQDTSGMAPGGAADVPLLGQNFLANYAYEIDDQQNLVTLKRAKQEIAAAARSAGRYSRTTRDDYEVPFTRLGRNLVVVAKVNGRECEMILDTGATTVCFSDKQLAAMGLNVPITARSSIALGVGGQRRGYAFFIDSITLGPIEKKGVAASVAQYSDIPMPLLGQSFLEGLKFTVDPENNVIRFAH